MGAIGSMIGKAFGYDPAGDAADAATEAARVEATATLEGSKMEASSQTEALNYLKEINALPQKFKEEALSRLGGLTGLEGGTGNQQELIDRAVNSPLYQSIMGGKEFGEDAILRNASATGGLRSGNTNYNMFDYNVRLQNEALLQSYNQQLMGLQGLAGLPTNENAIASGMAGVGAILGKGTASAGATTGSGMVGAAQAEQAGRQNDMDNTLAWAKFGASMYSDRRLKKNIKKIGTVKSFNFYSFDWNSIANKMGLEGSTFGCMADEVFKVMPKAIEMRFNFLLVNYKMIGVL